jgi:hypothetical protein
MEAKTRASNLADTLVALGGWSPSKLQQLERDEPALVNDIRTTLGVLWLPFSINAKLYEHVAAGDYDQASQLGAITVRSALSAPLLRPIASAALAVTGRKPESLLRVTHLAMAMLHQGFGPFVVNTCGPGRFDGCWVHPPEQVVRATAWQHGLAGAFREACHSLGAVSPTFAMRTQGDALHMTGSW